MSTSNPPMGNPGKNELSNSNNDGPFIKTLTTFTQANDSEIKGSNDDNPLSVLPLSNSSMSTTTASSSNNINSQSDTIDSSLAMELITENRENNYNVENTPIPESCQNSNGGDNKLNSNNNNTTGLNTMYFDAEDCIVLNSNENRNGIHNKNPADKNYDYIDSKTQEQEIHNFAMMANANANANATKYEGKNLIENRKNNSNHFGDAADTYAIVQKEEISSFAAMANNLNLVVDESSQSATKNKRDIEINTNDQEIQKIVLNPTCKDIEMDKDIIHKREKINSFAAMANADVISHNTIGHSADEMKKDTARRRREMNAFAAMANADGINHAANSPDVGDMKNDIARRKKEMNAFAAMANADDYSSPNAKEIEKDATRRRQEMSSFAAMANANDYSSPSAHEIEEDIARRWQEMNAFAAMANADVNNLGGNRTETDPTLREQQMTPFTAIMEAKTTESLDKMSINEIDSKITTMDSGAGTFVNAKKQAPNEANRNLDAALVSLSSDGDRDTISMRKNEFVSLGSIPESKQVKQRKPQHTQMYSECIRVAKPLFYGNQIHPRISNETKMLQSGYSHLMSNEPKNEITNLESVFSVFGQNAKMLRSEKESKIENDTERKLIEAKNFVTQYEPVWGDFRRLHREDRILGIEAEQVQEIPNSEEVEKEDPPVAPSGNGENLDSLKSDIEESDLTMHDEMMGKENVGESGSPTVAKYDTADSPDLFSKYARGDIDNFDKSLLWEKSTLSPVSETDAAAAINHTFRQIGTDPKGSFEGSELKKQVGLNDNISKALMSLSETSGLGGTTAASLAAADAGAAAIEAARAISVALKDGRPLSNLEMVGGRVPLYGCDDSPLPVPNDLGIFETKEDQCQSIMQFEAQEMIASRAVPNIFGSIVCPSNCSGPDDSQSWFSNRNCINPSHRTQSNGQLHSFQMSRHNRSRSRGFSNTDTEFPHDDKSDLPSPLPHPPNNRLPQSAPRTHISRESNVSFGQHPPSVHPLKYERDSEENQKSRFDQRIGWWNISDDFGLKPKRGKSRNKDTTMSSLQLPPERNERRHDFSWAMFPSQDKLANENRSFAELHPAVDTIKCLPYLSDRDPNVRHVQIETQIVSFPSIGEIEPFYCSVAIWHVESSRKEIDVNKLGNSRRITEFLHFDIVSNPDVELNCRASLWPYQDSDGEISNLDLDESSPNSQLQGTRCGVFPLHAQYSMDSLYAVLIVHKTLAEESDFDIYINPSRQKLDDKNELAKHSLQDLDRYMQRAGKSAERFGQLLMPFAFGVAPLIQILGADPPKIPASRAAQIPLFKFHAGEGDDPIVNHILALGASGNSERVPAELANDGTAMLVLRNFGYLGVHSSIHPHSKLACDRIVDFTGDKQVRRRRNGDILEKIDDEDGHTYVVDAWHKDFVGEPTVHGGRASSSYDDGGETINSPLYSQELAQIPLIGGQSSLRNVFFQTTFNNEMIIGIRALKNCTKRNITVKMEIRRLESDSDNNKILVVLPETPMIHNTRRGPFLVDNAYTSCAYHKVDPRFLDEFKIKLPLSLHDRRKDVVNDDGKLVAFFSVYHVSVKGRKKWSIMTSKGEVDEQSFPLELLGCGYLPLSTTDNAPCLITDGWHNVKLEYIVREVSTVVNGQNKDLETLDTTLDNNVKCHSQSSLVLERIDAISKNGENCSNEDEMKLKIVENMILQVETVAFSSVFVQNSALADFLILMPQSPRCRLHDESSTFETTFQQLEDSNCKKREEQVLSQHTADIFISKAGTPSPCPVSEIVPHFLRINFHLWRALVSGQGEPNSEWANPGSIIALRLYSFCSLLHILSKVCHYLAKTGVTDLNGKGKWNMTSMSKIILMLFDEDDLLCGPPEIISEDLNDETHSPNDNATRKEQDHAQANDCDCNLTRAILSLNSLDDSQKFNVAPASNRQQQDDFKLCSQDDIDIMNMRFKPSPLRTRSSSAPNAKGLKIDTKSDFQTALNSSISPAGSPFGSTSNGPAANRRKWMTLPSSSLATIQEDNDKISESVDRNQDSQDALDTEMFKTKASKVKQFRVPKLQQVQDETTNNKVVQASSLEVDRTAPEISSNKTEKVVPMNDDEIASAGTAFLDMIGKNFGYDVSTKELGGEEKSVGVSHHRKTKSRCSVDWSLPPTDLLIENYQEMEIFNRREAKNTDESDETSAVTGNTQQINNVDKYDDFGQTETKKYYKFDLDERKDEHPIHRQHGSTDPFENKSYPLSSFRERIALLKSANEGRWFPYTYEVIILQWASILSKQTKRKQLRNGVGVDSNRAAAILKDVANRSRGVAIACAPILFDIIKKSLSYRIHSIFSNKQGASLSKRFGGDLGAHPLVTLDTTLTSTLTELIKTVTDACIDSRNFDSWSFRRTSIIVNDSIARFLRDLFALLDTEVVHQLVLTYFQRFVLEDGKQWEDHDSKIGLRCSWEICKLRLNSITLFIRFADFIKVNKPLMLSWGPWSQGAPNRSTRRLFTKALLELECISMADFAFEGPMQKNLVQIPEMKSHWLLELVTDICLSATGHVEQNIQQRAAALLYELFWTTSVEGKINGSLTVLASMYVPFIRKMLHHTGFLANLTAKSQLRRDILACVVFVMQSAPFGLLRALWRNLCLHQDNQDGIANDGTEIQDNDDSSSSQQNTSKNDILDICGLLNLCLKTFEYEGSEANLEEELGGALSAKSSQWHREFLLAPEDNNTDTQSNSKVSKSDDVDQSVLKYTSTSSRKWFSHDIAIVIINASRNIVREYLSILRPTEDYDSLSGPIAHFAQMVPGRTANEGKTPSKSSGRHPTFTHSEKVNFARAIASVYLNCLSLRQSDIVFIKTLIASIEILKVFGIELFLAAVGETLQHWMRVILVHCGARRAKVRVEACDFLALLLRLTWDSYGSFFRVRVPLLAVQTEVMERIVATAASRYYKEQRRLQMPVQYLSNECAEAALTPLWRTLHRLHHSSASNNAAFKSALELLASRMKTLYKAYIAAHALAIVNRTNLLPKDARLKSISKNEHQNQFQIKRVVMESACFSKNIVGSKGVSLQDNAVTHNEVVEDSFLAAADIFSATELPLHRIAWLRKLAEFHSSCNKVAEEGACRLEIHKTLSQAVKSHGHLWSSIPFWPWASDASDGVHLNGEGPTSNSGNFEIMGDYEDNSEFSYHAHGSDEGKFIEQDQSFRRIFYRVANSVRMKTGEWDVGGNKTLFYGVTFASEYDGVPPWTSLREIEEDMVEEAEAAGELFLKAGLIESSRFCWSLATNFYSKVFNYPKLSYCYRKLSLVVASQVPIVDSRNQLEVSSPLGRFYRVYFHGGAADELMGKEFVYRASISMKLEEFCNSLCKVLTSILPDKTPIDLVLDDGDGRPQDQMRAKQRRPLGAVPREPITIKVTPLRALLKHPYPRGTSEWFYRQLEGNSIVLKEVSSGCHTSSRNQHSSVAFGRRPPDSDRDQQESQTLGGGAIVGVSKFSFTQHRDRQRATRDVLKTRNGVVVEKSLKVTELQVGRNLPNCVTRQAVIQRTIFNQSPLEAAVEVICSWCAVLFQTAVATNGLAVIGTQVEQGIGTRAEKVVADCIHKSRVKEIGRNMLSLKENDANQDNATDVSEVQYEKLSMEDIEINQKKLARALTIFMELLHVLVGRNRDLLLTALDDRKRRDLSSNESYSDRGNHHPVPPSPGQVSTASDGRSFFHEDTYHGSRVYDDGNNSSIGYGGTSASSTLDRTDKAMAIQRELQRAFISLCKVLQPIISRTTHNECPRWMKMSCQDNYFSGGFYRQARIAMGEELLFFGNSTDHDPHDGISHNNDALFVPLSILPTQSSSSHESEESTINSKTSDSYQGSRY